MPKDLVAVEAKLFDIVKHCRTPEQYLELKRLVREGRNELWRQLKLDTDTASRLNDLVAHAIAIGMIRGMQFGRRLGTYSEGFTGRLLAQPRIKKLLLSRASARAVCRALDDIDMEMPWSDLRRNRSLWADCDNIPKVKMAIGDARKAALQEQADMEWLRVTHGVGEEDSIFSEFYITKKRKRRVVKRAKANSASSPA